MEDYNQSIRDTLSNNAKLIYRKTCEVNDLNYEINCLKKNSLSTVQGIYDSVQNFDLHAMWCDFDHSTHKFKTTEEAKASKRRLQYMELAYFFEGGRPKNINLIDMIIVGYGSAYYFQYRRGKQEFTIRVPSYRRATIDDYDDLAYKIYSQPKPNVYKLEFQTLFLDELQDSIKEFLARTEEGKKE